MKIDKALLEQQIKEFKSQREEAMAIIHGINGAIQFCEHLLEVLKMKKPPEEEVHKLEDVLPEGAKVTKVVKPKP